MIKVAVLAVMDKLQEAVDALGREGERRYQRDGMFHLELGPKHYSSMMLQDELIEARAAVAELIEADHLVDRRTAEWATGECSSDDLQSAHARRREAIDRIGGAA